MAGHLLRNVWILEIEALRKVMRRFDWVTPPDPSIRVFCYCYGVARLRSPEDGVQPLLLPVGGDYMELGVDAEQIMLLKLELDVLYMCAWWWCVGGNIKV